LVDHPIENPSQIRKKKNDPLKSHILIAGWWFGT